MPDVQALVNDFVLKLKRRKIEGSQATAKHTAELLRQVVSQQRITYTNQAASLIDAVKAVGEQLIEANPVELAVGNIVRRVLHIIREENVSSAMSAVEELALGSDDDDEAEHENRMGLSAAAVAAAARSTLRAPSLQTLLEDIPDAATAPHPSSSGGDSEGKSKSAESSSRNKKLKHDVIEAINELIQEIDTCHELISAQAVEHIHQKDIEPFRRHLYANGKGPAVKGRSGAELVEGLVIKDEDYKVVKTRFSAFLATNLHQLLQGCGIKDLVVIGIQTPNCVRQTVFDAVSLDYRQVTVIADATATAVPRVHLDNIRDMKNIGVATPTLQEWLQL